MDIATNFITRSLSEIAPNASQSSLHVTPSSVSNNAFGLKLRQLISDIYCPHIFIMASDDTENFMKRKGFDDFASFIRPFGDRIFQSSTNNSAISKETLDSRIFDNDHDSIRFVPMEAVQVPRQWKRNKAWNTENGLENCANSRFAPGGDIDSFRILSQKLIEEWVQSGSNNYPENGFLNPILDYLKLLLSGNPVAEHETFSHPVGCLIVITSHNTNPMATVMRLFKEINNAPFPNFISKEILHYYLFIHDEDNNDLSNSKQIFQQMRRSLGANSHFIRLRSNYISAKPLDTDRSDTSSIQSLKNAPRDSMESESFCSSSDDAKPITFVTKNLRKFPIPEWRSSLEVQAESEQSCLPLYPLLPVEEVEGMKKFVQTMLYDSIYPFMQRCVRAWEEDLTPQYGNLTTRLLFASKKYWSRNHSSHSQGNYDPLSLIYSSEKQESIKRKMADFSFMLRDYKRAYEIYDEIRNTFSQDKAWNYLASCEEIQIICLLMQNRNISLKSQISYLNKWFDEMVYIYAVRLHSFYYTFRSVLVTSLLLSLKPAFSIDFAASWLAKILEPGPISLNPFETSFLNTTIAGMYSNKEHVGVTDGNRRRKAAFWFAYSAGFWRDCGHCKMAEICWNLANRVYSKSGWESLSEHMLDLKPTLSENFRVKNTFH
ncbi:Transport protein particle subunit trs85-1 [Schizosaccharomyces pombe]